MTLTPPTSNRLLHGIALLCMAALIVALISQYVFDMRPCAWCVFQRLIYLVIAVVCWAAIAVKRWPPVAFFLSAAVPLLAIGGAMAAWYQYDVASDMFSCDLTFADRFMVNSGLDGGLPWLFGIQASCMDARVDLLGVEYAIWSLILFMLIAVLVIRHLAKPRT